MLARIPDIVLWMSIQNESEFSGHGLVGPALGIIAFEGIVEKFNTWTTGCQIPGVSSRDAYSRSQAERIVKSLLRNIISLGRKGHHSVIQSGTPIVRSVSSRTVVNSDAIAQMMAADIIKECFDRSVGWVHSKLSHQIKRKITR